ncbi:uncharacterized protein [Arachis hypogaea]|uniref:uncharacterized protein n=1 Tax=Arachis hypogaea TaxID=3818 RepID=UPI000DEC6B1C|nr:uncharacterized protein LOC112715647 [Arachis hypogaea]QHO16189.1 uncharacterized protein DS421_10g301490 [Arachis hypogaea]
MLTYPRGSDWNQHWTGLSTSGRRESAGPEVVIVDNPRKKKSTSSLEGALTVMEKNFDAGNFIDSQLLPSTEDFFHGGDLASQAKWVYRTLLRAAAIARKAEPVLAGAQTLENKLQSSVNANEKYKLEVKSLQTQLAAAEGKVKTSDATVVRLTERELTLEGQLSVAQSQVKELEKKRDVDVSSANAAKAEAADMKKNSRDSEAWSQCHQGYRRGY